MERGKTCSTAGIRVATKRCPIFIYVLYRTIQLAVVILITAGSFFLFGWKQLINEPIVVSTLLLACGITGTAFFSLFLKFPSQWMGLKRQNRLLVAYVQLEKTKFFATLVVFAALIFLDLTLLKTHLENFPLAHKLTKINLQINEDPLRNHGLQVHFWDYSTWFNPKWFSEIEIFIPYEKGPPEKLLSKIFFQNKKSKQVELELHGKRPRFYRRTDIEEIFHDSRPKLSSTLLNLQKEAGIQTKPSTLSLIELHHNSEPTTLAIGIPWHDQDLGHAFFWNPNDGSVFQIRCNSPCWLSPMLDQIIFSENPKESFQQRRDWTLNQLKTWLDRLTTNPSDNVANQTLQLYLVSLLTLDPRNPEIYFHLGKLSQNKETVLSTIKYGHDVQLDPDKIMELQSVADNLP